MLYMTTADGTLRLIVLETFNLDELKAGRPVRTVDGEVLITWTPDAPWLAEQIARSDGDLKTIGRLVDQARGRPENDAPRPAHLPEVTHFAGPTTAARAKPPEELVSRLATMRAAAGRVCESLAGAGPSVAYPGHPDPMEAMLAESLQVARAYATWSKPATTKGEPLHNPINRGGDPDE